MKNFLFIAALAALVSLSTGCESQPTESWDKTTIESAPAKGACTSVKDCKDDGNPCTVAVCEGHDGTKICINKVLNNGTSCDDGDICTVPDKCNNGKCVGAPGTCVDDNPCTDDSCTPGHGCLRVPLVGSCDDGDACTSDDTCKAGKCQSGKDVCECKADSDCVDDGNLCNGTLACENNKCVVAKGTAVTCKDEDPCNTVACEPATGKCEVKADKASEGMPCADNATCLKGFCEVAKVTECSTNKQCDDGKVFTDNTCNKEGKCEFTLNTADCDDGNVCTENDAYKNGVCVGEVKSCNDNSPCTTDICDPVKGCLHTAAPKGTKCEDGDVYTYNICESGKCVNTECDADWQCDDKEYCTKDECTYGKCKHINLAKYACDDGDACTTDNGCVDGTCSTVAKSCDDGNVNTADSCNPKTGACVHTLVVKPECTKTSDCNDGNGCTSNKCDGGKCKFAPVGMLTLCNDGNVCTYDGHCANGSCQPGMAVKCDDGNANTADSCNATTGKCVNTPVSGGNTGTVSITVKAATIGVPKLFYGSNGNTKQWKMSSNGGQSSHTFTLKKSEACVWGVHVAIESDWNTNKWWGCNPGLPSLKTALIYVNGLAIPTTTQFFQQACDGGGDGNVVVTKKQLGCN